MLNLDSEFQKLCKRLEKDPGVIILTWGENASFHFREIKTICEYFYDPNISEKKIKTCLKKFERDGSFIPTPKTPKALREVFEIMLAVKNIGFKISDIPCEYRRKWQSLPELLKNGADKKNLKYNLARCCRFLCEALSRDSDKPGHNEFSTETARYNVTVVYWFKHLLDKFLKIPYTYPLFACLECLDQIVPPAQQNDVQQVYAAFPKVLNIAYNLFNPIKDNLFYKHERLHKEWMHDPNTKRAFEENWKNSNIYHILFREGDDVDDIQQMAVFNLLEAAYMGNSWNGPHFVKKFDQKTAELLKNKELNVIDVLAGIHHGLLTHSEWLSAEQGYAGKRKNVEQNQKNKENQDTKLA